MDNEIRLVVLIERFKAHLIEHFNKTVEEIEAILQELLLNHDIADVSHKDIKEIIKDSHQAFFVALVGFGKILKNEWRGFYETQADFETKFAQQKLSAMSNKPKKELVQAVKQIMFDEAVFKKPQSVLGGVTLDELLTKFSKDEADRLTATLRLAHHEGWTNHKLMQAIRGTKARQFKDGILQGATRRQAETIARTGTAIMASEAQKAFAEKNKDIIRGVQIIATLDRRTSVKCQSLDKKIMPLDKAVYPPYHFNCRSRTILVYKGMKELPKRASENGVVDNVEYYEWLKTQPPAFQDEALGKSRAKLFREGGLTIEQFKALQLDRNFKPLTLKEMRELEPLIFDKVFNRTK